MAEWEISIWHGESGTIWYVVHEDHATMENSCSTFNGETIEDARKLRNLLNGGE